MDSVGFSNFREPTFTHDDLKFPRTARILVNDENSVHWQAPYCTAWLLLSWEVSRYFSFFTCFFLFV